MSDSSPPDNTSDAATNAITSKSDYLEKINVLIVDDEPALLGVTQRLLYKIGPEIGEVLACENPEEALQQLKERQVGEVRQAIHLFISDLKMRGSTDIGIKLLEQVKELSRRPYTIVYSGYPDKDELKELCHSIVVKTRTGLENEVIKLLPECRKYWRNLTMSADERLSSDPLQKVFVVRINGRMIVMTREEVEVYSQELEILGTVEDVAPDVSEAEIAQLREDAEAMLAKLEMDPSTKSTEFPESTEVEPFKSARLSPLPALRLDRFDPANNNRTLLQNESREEGIYWLAMIDLDNTLYEAESKHSIMLHHFARFLKENHSADFREGHGSLKHLDELIGFCDKWEAERKEIAEAEELGEEPKVKNPTKYQNGIIKSGRESARAFKGMSLKKLQEYGREFVEEGMGGGKFFEYTPGVIQKIKDHGILPVITTGLPDFLLQPILEKLEVAHGKGMTYKTDKTDENGILIGDEPEVNMGLAEQKAVYGKELTNRGYAIALAMGDSVGDMGLFKCAIFKSRAKEDVNGAIVLANASKNAKDEVLRTYSIDEGDGRLQEVTKRKPALNVVAAVALALRKVFEPLYEYRDKVKNEEKPEELREYIEDLEQRSAMGKKHNNLENLKRIRDILRKEGMNDDEMIAELKKWYPAVIAADVVKSHMVNTRNKADFEAHLAKIGLNREMIEEILAKNIAYHKEHGSMPPTVRRRSSFPPPVGDPIPVITTKIITPQ